MEARDFLLRAGIPGPAPDGRAELSGVGLATAGFKRARPTEADVRGWAGDSDRLSYGTWRHPGIRKGDESRRRRVSDQAGGRGGHPQSDSGSHRKGSADPPAARRVEWSSRPLPILDRTRAGSHGASDLGAAEQANRWGT